MRKAIISLLFVLGPLNAEVCKDIDNDLERLNCYDRQSDLNKVPKIIIDARKKVTMGFKDPGSTQFRNEKIFTKYNSEKGDSQIVCGEVNGKNSYGAYVGFKRYYYSDADVYKVETDKNREYYKIMHDILCIDKLIR